MSPSGGENGDLSCGEEEEQPYALGKGCDGDFMRK